MHRLLMLMAVMAAAPAAGQTLQFGPTIAGHGYEAWTKLAGGFYAGVSIDPRDNLRTGVFYVLKGEKGYRVRSVEVPVLYRRRIAENTHLVVGPAPSYDGEQVDLGAYLGITVRADGRPVGLEAAFVYGLRDYHYLTHDDSEPGHRVLRIGLEVPLT